jgi:hypothetical protein
VARGKHRAASQRRYDAHADRRIGELEREAVQLRARVLDLTQQLTVVAPLRQQLAAVKAERDANATPELLQAREYIGRLQTELAEARAEYKRIQGNWEKVTDRLAQLFGGGSGVDFWEWLLDTLGTAGVVALGIPDAARKRIDNVGVANIERARGRRGTSLKELGSALDGGPDVRSLYAQQLMQAWKDRQAAAQGD